MNYKKHIKKREFIERLEVVGPIDDSKAVMNDLHNDGFRLTRSGMYIKNSKADGSRFLFIAEREMALTTGSISANISEITSFCTPDYKSAIAGEPTITGTLSGKLKRGARP